MERRLKMMIAGSMAAWVPVASAAQPSPAAVDPAKAFRLKATPVATAPARATDRSMAQSSTPMGSSNRFASFVTKWPLRKD